MTGRKANSYQLMWMLGLALTLPMILVSGPLAGFLISQLLVKRFGWPGFLTPLLMVAGLAGSGWQAFRLIQKLGQTRNHQS